MINRKSIVNSHDARLRQFNRMPIPSADVTISQWFCSLINVCSSLQSLLCLFERNIALQPKIQGNLGDLYEQNDVSVSKVQFRFKVFIPRIPSIFRYRGKSLALYLYLILFITITL